MSIFGKKDTPSSPFEQPPAAPAPGTPMRPPSPAPESPRSAATQRINQTVLGASFVIKGDVTAEENITIEGTVEGTIVTTRDVHVTTEGKVRANIRGATVSIAGRVRGNIEATNKVELSASGQLEGNIHAPKLSIAESAQFKGSIDMSPPAARTESKEPAKENSKK